MKLPNMRTCVQRRSWKNPQIAKNKKKNNQVKIYKLYIYQQKPLSSKFMMSSDESVKFVLCRNNVLKML